MKRVLGIDLGSTSIGWAIIDEYSNEVSSNTEATILNNDKIVAIGSRIIPLTTDESSQFSKGQAITKNSDRTLKRTQRKGYDRYQLRRSALLKELSELGMYNGTTLHLSKLALWELRAKAVEEQISLLELGRVLCHINQKRGYRTVKSDYSDKATGEYVGKVVGNYRTIQESHLTIGQHLYNNLKEDSAFRCKEIIFPRDAYIEEFDTIIAQQRKYYPEALTDKIIDKIRNRIIFHQRPLKSCKHLVAKCELERHDVKIGNKIINCGPKVAPRSSPLFQVCKIWESINNLNINNKENDTLFITDNQKIEIFNFMNTHDKLKANDLKNILQIKSREWLFGKAIGTGLKGNTTYCEINKALESYPNKEELLKFDLSYTTGSLVDVESGEMTKIVDASFEQQPLYKLWHTLYSISDISELKSVLKENFKIDDEKVIDNLCQIDFVKSGYSNKSSRAIRKILPYLQEGKQYYEAKIAAGYNDTTLTKEQNESRELAEKLLPISKGELRQPVVEKVLNQLVNLVNALMDEYGRFDEVRVELARNLKQSRDERESATKAIDKSRKENEEIAKRIQEYDLTPTRTRIQKYKLWQESQEYCIYCNVSVNVTEFLMGAGVEVEHIIPRSVLFDDSFSNKVCACRNCNKEKNNRTAYDYMKSRGEGEFKAYIERVNELFYKGKISKTKRNKLLMPQSELPTDFIARQLNETQYIAKKAKQMLQSVCHNVHSTSGQISDFIRHIWGWDEVLHSLNFKRYKEANLTEIVERDVNGEKVEVERIKDWSKRMDHRHHAIDALTIACTKQGYIQRINNLNSLKEEASISFKNEKQGEQTRQRLTRLERYIQMQPHFSTSQVKDAIAGIAVSFKSGKRAASVGKRYIRKNGRRICVQSGIIIPRGPLSEDSIYGRINKNQIVKKYKIGDIDLKKAKDIVDGRIKQIVIDRLNQFGGNSKKAFVEKLLDHQGNQIRSVRCYTGLNATVPVRYNENGEPIAFVKPGNNHHVAIYVDENGKWVEHIATFWHAVERKKYGFETIIKNCAAAWDMVSENEHLPTSFVEQLPEKASLQFKFSMQQNEMFILGMDEELYQDAMNNNNYAQLSKYLYRVQKLTEGAYVFRKHTETQTDDRYKDENGKKIFSVLKSRQLESVQWVTSLGALAKLNPHKVLISVTGKISEI